MLCGAAAIVLLLWFGVQLPSNALTPSGAGGVAFRAQLGGFLAGMILMGLFRRPGFRLANPSRI